jgi:hypothetical protein
MVALAGYRLLWDGRIVGVMANFARSALSDVVIVALVSVPSHIALGIDRHRSAEALRTAEERMRFAPRLSRDNDRRTICGEWAPEPAADREATPAGAIGPAPMWVRSKSCYRKPDSRPVARDSRLKVGLPLTFFRTFAQTNFVRSAPS